MTTQHHFVSLAAGAAPLDLGRFGIKPSVPAHLRPSAPAVPATRTTLLSDILDFDPADQDRLCEYAAKIYPACYLLWDYVQTILDQAALMRLEALRPLSRAIRELHRKYFAFRSRCRTVNVDSEDGYAQQLEDILMPLLSKASKHIALDIKAYGLAKEQRYLVLSVYQAMLLYRAIIAYGHDTDRFLESRGLPPVRLAIVQDEIISLGGLLPHFAGDCWNPNAMSLKTWTPRLHDAVRDMAVVRGNKHKPVTTE